HGGRDGAILNQVNVVNAKFTTWDENMQLTSRERVLTALDHEEPDRVPLFIGTSGATTVLGPGYERLRTHLGVRGGPLRWLSKPLQYTLMDEEVLVRLGSDGRPVGPGPAESALRREISEDCTIDEWGITWRRAPDSIYFEMAGAPLRGATIDDIERYPWPNLTAPSRFAGLAERAKAIQAAGYAAVLATGVILFERAYMLRGIDALLMDMAADEDFFTALLVKLKSLAIPYLRTLLSHVGPYVDVLVTGDDLGMTAGPMMSPRAYRRLIKPHHAELLSAIKEHARGKIFFHSCGNIHALLGDLADVGVDLINPVQVSAGEMGDTAGLKRQFGDRLSFCGAIDTQWVMPRGTPDDVRREVRRRIADLAPGGGYAAAAVHCIQPDVPPENIVAMCEEVAVAGRYPLRV
ncbi:MAG: uroporphyrinogen decarboxylase family protein, partial [Thermoguttaceae bacterium]